MLSKTGDCIDTHNIKVHLERRPRSTSDGDGLQ